MRTCPQAASPPLQKLLCIPTSSRRPSCQCQRDTGTHPPNTWLLLHTTPHQQKHFLLKWYFNLFFNLFHLKIAHYTKTVVVSDIHIMRHIHTNKYKKCAHGRQQPEVAEGKIQKKTQYLFSFSVCSCPFPPQSDPAMSAERLSWAYRDFISQLIFSTCWNKKKPDTQNNSSPSPTFILLFCINYSISVLSP